MKADRHPRTGNAVVSITLLVLVSAFAFAQTASNQVAGSPTKAGESNEVTVDGCLYGGQGNFELISADNSYELRGDPSALSRYMGTEVQVRGKQEGSDNGPSIIVSGITLVFKAPFVELSKTISDPSNWHFQTNKLYGIKFAMPAVPENAAGAGSTSANFVAETGTVTLGSVPIPSEVYPGSSFAGGNFSISVNPEIKNSQSCEKFGASDPRFVSHSTFGGTQYSKLTDGDAAMGTSYEELYFHTFQNGSCYEVAFSLGEVNSASQDFGCRTPRHGDTGKVVAEFMRRISYFLPSTIHSPEN